MKQTDNFNLNLPELSDKLSPAAFNENAVKIDGMLAKGVRMACGTYTGNGSATRSISTPGFTPMAVLMTERKTVADSGIESGKMSTSLALEDSVIASSGWTVWVGQNLPAKYYTETSETMPDGEVYTRYYAYDTTLQFTPAAGGLSWKMATAGAYGAKAANNESGTVYQWIAFGLPDGE